MPKTNDFWNRMLVYAWYFKRNEERRWGESHMWHAYKIGEEFGEFCSEMVAWGRANPRKLDNPAYSEGSRAKVLKELSDIIITASAAFHDIHLGSLEQEQKPEELFNMLFQANYERLLEDVRRHGWSLPLPEQPLAQQPEA